MNVAHASDGWLDAPRRNRIGAQSTANEQRGPLPEAAPIVANPAQPQAETEAFSLSQASSVSGLDSP